MSVESSYYNGVARLSPEARSHLRSVEWLFSQSDKHRGSGRTTVSVLAYLRAALEANVGTRIRVVDHSGNGSQDEHVVRQIAGFGVNVQDYGMGVMVVGRKAYPSYLPQNTGPGPEVAEGLPEEFTSLVRLMLKLGFSVHDLVSTVRSQEIEAVMNT